MNSKLNEGWYAIKEEFNQEKSLFNFWSYFLTCYPGLTALRRTENSNPYLSAKQSELWRPSLSEIENILINKRDAPLYAAFFTFSRTALHQTAKNSALVSNAHLGSSV